MHKRQSQNLRAGTILFFGDSQIQGLAVTSVSPQSANFGIGHQQMRQLLKQISGYPGLQNAERLVIGVGINDLLQAPQLDAEKTISDLVTALKCCLHKTAILSILPVNENILKSPGLNQRIIDFNQKLQIAASNYGFIYIDTFTSFSHKSSGIAPWYDLGDGLHLNPEGYELLIRILRTELLQGNGDEQ